MHSQALFRQIPSVDALLQEPALREAAASVGYESVRSAVRDTLAEIRERIRAGDDPDVSTEAIVTLTLTNVRARTTPTLRPAINATGVLIHTNLGRSPLSENALHAMQTVGSGYSNLEYDLDAGARGSRYTHVGDLLAELTGAEAGLVANNAAAALVLMLATHAAGSEVIISRAHLVEIGGGFRIPDIMRQSGAMLREVGTTNKTYAGDYEDAVVTDLDAPAQSAMILRVHTSNFQISGFVHQPALDELANVAHRHNLVLADDIGSGALLDTTQFGLVAEPRPQESIAAGADLVSFSGDKLLGGPQAGCIVGRRKYIDAIKRHPLMRAFRVDKTTLAGLDSTLRSYQRGTAEVDIPLWQMVTYPAEEIHAEAWRWAEEMRGAGVTAEVVAGESTIGGGSLPGQTLETWLVAVDVENPEYVAADLRRQEPAIIVRIEDDRLLLDPRTVLPGQDKSLISGLKKALAEQK